MNKTDTDVRSGRVLGRGEGRRLPGGILETVVKVESAETGGGFALVEYGLDANVWEGPEPHVHNSGSETFYILEGSMVFVLDNEKIVAGPGTCVHIPAGAVHTFSNPGPGRVRFSQILCPGTLLGMIEDIVRLLQAGIPEGPEWAAVFRRHDSEVIR